ncbi:MAG: divalent-cation tolerance protein CutA [Holosporales bacterium]
MSLAVLYCPVPDSKTAADIARGLLEQRLVACVNIIPAMQSVYWWEGEIKTETETLLLAKTTTTNERPITEFIERTHLYTLPCIAFLPLEGVNQAYADFVRAALAERTAPDAAAQPGGF